MKEVMGRILSWDGASQEGMIEGSDGALYSFTVREWTEEQPPEVDGEVLAICQNGRDVSRVEYLGIEHIPFSTSLRRRSEISVKISHHFARAWKSSCSSTYRWIETTTTPS